jgi:hypothetical protein
MAFTHKYFHSLGGGKKTAAHVVADVLFDFGLKPSKEVVVTSARSIDYTFIMPKTGILVIEVSEGLGWCSELTHAMQMADVGNVVIIVAGNYCDIDFAMMKRPEIKKLLHTALTLAPGMQEIASISLKGMREVRVS